VTPTDASTFVLTVAFLSAAALVASVLPAWRAARLDPARALRAE
jgi:ABC-type lipoprotein release transport system permease subunit